MAATEARRKGRTAKGSVLRTASKRTGATTYALRFTAYDERQYVTLGSDRDGWTDARA